MNNILPEYELPLSTDLTRLPEYHISIGENYFIQKIKNSYSYNDNSIILIVTGYFEKIGDLFYLNITSITENNDLIYKLYHYIINNEHVNLTSNNIDILKSISKSLNIIKYNDRLVSNREITSWLHPMIRIKNTYDAIIDEYFGINNASE